MKFKQYTVKKNALADGTIEDNFNYLFEAPNDFKTRFIRHHLKVLREYSKGCNHIVEIGVDGVNSTWAFLCNHPREMTSIDILNAKAPEILALVQEKCKMEGVHFEFLQVDSLSASVPDIDFLFIDGEHTYQQVKKELEIYAPNVNKYIAFHDTIKFSGVKHAVNDFLSRNDEWKIIYEAKDVFGLTIIKRNLDE